MRIEIHREQVEQIAAHATAAYPGECCGLMIGTFDGDDCCVVELRPSTNATPDPAKRYVIDPLTYLHADCDARQRGMEIVGIYHSHPDADPVPSRTDCDEGWPGYVYLIAAVRGGQPDAMRAWRFDDAKQAFEVDLVVRPGSG
jgi:proteasome lid subunit RPN8/RPN11